MSKLSIHSKRRMVERGSIKHKDQKIFYRNARANGLSAWNKNTPYKVKKYLLSKSPMLAKIYQGYVFIYSKNKKQLITFYEAPEWVKEELESGKM